jgi:hypothetical protein
VKFDQRALAARAEHDRPVLAVGGLQAQGLLVEIGRSAQV